MPKITLKNLYIDNKCRFCDVTPNQKHFNCYHGIGDMLGYNDLKLDYKEL